MVTKNGMIMQSVSIATTESQPVRPKVAFMGIVEKEKYPKAVWNSVMREQQMQIRKLCK